MNASIQRRIEALEGPPGGACVSCELLALNRAATAPTDELLRPCSHWPRRTLAEELAELNSIKEMAP